MKKNIICLVMVLVFVFSLFSCGKSSSKYKLSDVVDFVLEVEAGRDVKILQLTDIQIIDSDQMRTPTRLHEWSIEPWKPEHMEELAFDIMRQAVAKSNPDLIVLSGDNIYGEFDDNGTSLHALITEMDSYKIPWTFAFGNHDNETKIGVNATIEAYLESKYCLFKRGCEEIEEDGEKYFPIPGNGNFNIGITQNGMLTEVVYLMDSNGHTDSDRSQNMYSTVGLQDAQIEWFKQKNEILKSYNHGRSPKCIGFFHHPMRAYGDAVQKYGYMSALHSFYDENGDYGRFKAFTIPENSVGDSGTMSLDAGEYIDQNYEFHNLLKNYNCEGWFFGHDHVNNASAVFEGVRYTYGLKASKYDSYTTGQVGGTCIEVGKKFTVNHVYYV